MCLKFERMMHLLYTYQGLLRLRRFGPVFLQKGKEEALDRVRRAMPRVLERVKSATPPSILNRLRARSLSWSAPASG